MYSLSDHDAVPMGLDKLLERLHKSESASAAARLAAETLAAATKLASETMAAAKVLADTAKMSAETLAETTRMAAKLLSEKTDAADEWRRAHAVAHGLTDAPPDIMVANPIAYAWHHPSRALWLLAAWLGIPAGLACVLILLAGPAGGLLFLLQSSGIKSISVPSPSPSPAAPLVIRNGTE